MPDGDLHKRALCRYHRLVDVISHCRCLRYSYTSNSLSPCHIAMQQLQNRPRLSESDHTGQKLPCMYLAALPACTQLPCPVCILQPPPALCSCPALLSMAALPFVYLAAPPCTTCCPALYKFMYVYAMLCIYILCKLICMLTTSSP